MASLPSEEASRSRTESCGGLGGGSVVGPSGAPSQPGFHCWPAGVNLLMKSSGVSRACPQSHLCCILSMGLWAGD